MQNQGIFTASHSWFTAQGAEDGKPTMFRGRAIPAEFIGEPALPSVFVITVHFDATDETGLPTPAQYQMIEDIEKQFIDPVETQQIGLIAFIKTFDGTIKYFMYVSDIESVSNALLDVSKISSCVELAAGDDSDWSEYRAFLHNLGVTP